jgi:hypothetical protein
MVLQLGLLWPCPQILRPDWKGFPMATPLAYLGLIISDEGKKFYNIGTWSKCHLFCFYREMYFVNKHTVNYN